MSGRLRATSEEPGAKREVDAPLLALSLVDFPRGRATPYRGGFRRAAASPLDKQVESGTITPAERKTIGR